MIIQIILLIIFAILALGRLLQYFEIIPPSNPKNVYFSASLGWACAFIWCLITLLNS
jgi:hypothetical protein